MPRGLQLSFPAHWCLNWLPVMYIDPGLGEDHILTHPVFDASMEITHSGAGVTMVFAIPKTDLVYPP